MQPYETGKAALTNGLASVTGKGTLWLTNTQSGDLFTIDGQHMYVVTAVASDTRLTLNRVYAEATASEQSYTIARVSSGWGLPADLAQACIDLTDKYRAKWIAGKGPKGDKGDQMFTWKGAYSAALTYNPGDMVCLSGALYVCLALAVGQDPTTANSAYWTQLVFNSYNITEGDPA